MSDAHDAARFRFLDGMIDVVVAEGDMIVFGFDTSLLEKIKFKGVPTFSQVIDSMMTLSANDTTQGH